MRLRCSRRWEAIWSRSIDSFDRSREDRAIKKVRVSRRTTAAGEGTPPVTTVSERTVRQQNGDPRYLTIAARVAAREDRIWRQDETVATQEDDASGPPSAVRDGLTRERVLGPSSGVDGLEMPADARRFASLPTGLCDLEYLARGLRNGTGSVPYRLDDVGKPEDMRPPVSTLFEQRCAEAFRYLGFEVRELGQGCGRVADCLAVAAVERFAVIIDAKVRRRGYTLGTDDRQFCEYATRHTRELALSGIEKVYFAVIGRGFRQEDLDKLAGFMTGTPIRSVCFIETAALLQLVNDSIARRREFRLDQLDRLLFGNKIIDEAMLTR
jgi:hypothetical protein